MACYNCGQVSRTGHSMASAPRTSPRPVETRARASRNRRRAFPLGLGFNPRLGGAQEGDACVGPGHASSGTVHGGGGVRAADDDEPQAAAAAAAAATAVMQRGFLTPSDTQEGRRWDWSRRIKKETLCFFFAMLSCARGFSPMSTNISHTAGGAGS